MTVSIPFDGLVIVSSNEIVPDKESDQQILDGIEEYRALRAICDNLGIYSKEDIVFVLGKCLFDRIVILNRSTWPDRNERFKAFNDARIQ